MQLSKKFKATAAAIASTSLLTSACSGPAINNHMSQSIDTSLQNGVEMNAPLVPHQAALECLADSFNRRWPNERLVVVGIEDRSGKISEDNGFFLPQDPQSMLMTSLTRAGFRLAERSTDLLGVMVRERQGQAQGMIETSFNHKMNSGTFALAGSVTSLEFNIDSNAAKVQLGPFSYQIENGYGKVSTDLRAVSLESGNVLWADAGHVSYRSTEGGPGAREFGLLGVDDRFFGVDFRMGSTPSLADLVRASMAKTAYYTLGPFVQDDFPQCDQWIGKKYYTQSTTALAPQ